MIVQRRDKPLSVEQIVQRAGTTDFDARYKLQQWFRTAQVMLKQASIYEHEGDDQEAYLILFRYARLILEDLPKHPDAREPQYRESWKNARRGLQLSLAKLEQLKPTINTRSEQYEERLKARKALREAQLDEQPNNALASRESPQGKRLSFGAQNQSDDEMGNYGDISTKIDAVENSDMAVSLANTEIRRRIRRSHSRSADPDHGWQDLSLGMIDARSNLHRRLQLKAPEQSTISISSNSLDYPQVPDLREKSSHAQLAQSVTREQLSKAPEIPPKQNIPENTQLWHDQLSSHLPLVPNKVPVDHISSSPAHRQADNSSIRSPAPFQAQFAYSSHLENGTPLRTIFLPSTLRHTFLNIARENTRRNRETMGLLCGTLIRNALFISKLVIPEQTSTSDTCEMEDEEALLEYCEAQPEGLWTLGWIHTHPTQTCFMSSRDLHTHMGYQRMLLEAIAIVCAPTKSPDWGIFRLTDPPGMGAIAKCSQPGLFHPHDESKLYTDALGRPGHVIEHKGLEFETVDLRAKH